MLLSFNIFINYIYNFQELNYNFYTIILPETAKTIQTEEPSVLAMIAELNEVITSLGLPVTDLLAQLEMHLHYVIMEMPVSFFFVYIYTSFC